MKRVVASVIFPIITAIIWGTAFVAQSSSTEHVGAMTFNAARSVVAFFVLLLLVPLFRRFEHSNRPSPTPVQRKVSRRHLIWGGFCCGTALAIASNLQQMGMVAGASVGKTSFITTLYVVLVPICGLFLKKRVPVSVWIGVLLAVAGLYCLCINESFTIVFSDLLVLLCAFAYTVHILVIDHFVERHNGVELSCVQFFFATIWSAIGMFFFENPQWSDIMACLGDILYVGILSSGVAYTLQIIAQKASRNPTVVTILLSLESVFGVLAGAIILHEMLSPREYIGCALMLIAVLLAQIPFPSQRESLV